MVHLFRNRCRNASPHLHLLQEPRATRDKLVTSQQQRCCSAPTMQYSPFIMTLPFNFRCKGKRLEPTSYYRFEKSDITTSEITLFNHLVSFYSSIVLQKNEVLDHFFKFFTSSIMLYKLEGTSAHSRSSSSAKE